MPTTMSPTPRSSTNLVGSTTSDDVLAQADADDRSELVEQVLKSLPDHQRVPLVLYHFEDLPYQEIAERLQVSLPKVKTRHHARPHGPCENAVERPRATRKPRRVEPLMNNEEKLERLVGRVLKQQPLRKAPGTLEARVFAALEAARRAALVAREFPALAARRARDVPARLVRHREARVDGVMWLLTDARPATVVAGPVTWYEHLSSFVSTLGSLGYTLVHAIPPHWLFIGIAFTATLYVALFALGATAYRTLYVNK